MKHSDSKFLLFFLVAAFLFKLVFLVQFSALPIFHVVELDELFHVQAAQQLLKNHFVTPHVFFRAPLYIYLLGVFSAVSQNLFFLRLAQSVIGLGTLFYIYQLSTLIFSEKTGRVTAILSLFFSMFLFYDSMLLITGLITFLNTAALYYLYAYLKEKKEWSLYLSFFLFGLSAVARPNILIILPFLWIFLLIKKQIDWKQALLVIFLVLLPILPVTLYNYHYSKELILVSSQGGINFYLGNNENANGFTPRTDTEYFSFGSYKDSVSLYAEKKAEELSEYHEPLSPAGISAFWYDRGKMFWKQQPQQAFSLFVKKSLLYFQGIEIPNNRNFRFFADRNFLWKIFFRLHSSHWYLIPGLCFMLFFAIKEKDREARMALCAVLPYALSVILFFVCSRYRVPMMPLYIVYTVGGVGALWRHYQKSVWPIAFASIFLLSSCFALFDFAGVFSEAYRNENYEWWVYGNAYRKLGMATESLDAYQKALQIDPNFVPALLNTGMLQYRLKKIPEALSSFEKVLTIEPRNVRALNNIGACYEALMKYDQAMFYYEYVTRLRPDYYLVYRNMADCCYQMTLYEKSNDWLKRYYEHASEEERKMTRKEYPHLWKLLKND